MNSLFLRLEGPLQSWGTRARWTVRDTVPEPTKSGVVGLLACALGWGRQHDREIHDMGVSLAFGVRVDRPGELVRDYQTIFGGAMSADGKVKITPSTKTLETVVSPRLYLADASFLAVVCGTQGRIEQLAAAIQDPVWPLYLGRKSCVPAVHPFEGTGQFDSILDALEQWPRSHRSDCGELRAVIEVDPGQGIRRQDQIETLSLRRYLPRYSQDRRVDPPHAEEEADTCISPA